MSRSFEFAHAFVARWEGGFVDDPHDPGGATKLGVSLRALIAKGIDFNNDGVINRRDIIDMTPDQALDFYRREYWVKAVCPRLPDPLALVHYDCAVNQGAGRAARILQKSVGAKADGIIGRRTIEATEHAWSRDPGRLLGEYCARRAAHYSSLALAVRYGLGWFRRLFDAHRAALELP